MGTSPAQLQPPKSVVSVKIAKIKAIIDFLIVSSEKLRKYILTHKKNFVKL